MQQRDIEDLIALEWNQEINRDPKGGFVLTVSGLDDFAVFGNSRNEVLEQFEDALQSHLAGYFAVGKIVPVPAGRVVEHMQVTGGDAAWNRLGFNAATGRIRVQSATT